MGFFTSIRKRPQPLMVKLPPPLEPLPYTPMDRDEREAVSAAADSSDLPVHAAALQADAHAAQAVCDWMADTVHGVSADLDDDALAFQQFLMAEQNPTGDANAPNPDVQWAMQSGSMWEAEPRVTVSAPAITQTAPAIAAAKVEQPAVIQQAAVPAQEIKRGDPLAEQLILMLMKEASQRSNEAASAYESLTGKAAAFAARSRKSAKTAWTVIGLMAATMLLGGMCGSYKLGRATSTAELLQHKATSNALALSERDSLRIQLTVASAAQLQTEWEAQIARQTMARANVELEMYHQPTAYQPATQPSAMHASAASHDVWASLLGR